jgi:hypothetical protein
LILRAIRGRANRAELAALQAALVEALGSPASPGHGLARFHLGSRSARANSGAADATLDVALLSFWDAAESAAAGDARSISPLSLARPHVRDLDIAHFEVDETIVRHSREQPVALRIATGRFSKPGADAEMQNLLRDRALLIDDEMTEAYVGRRLDGSAVEVTFVSAWRRLPADRSLEQAFWPDIALRYDQFSVEVYAAIA